MPTHSATVIVLDPATRKVLLHKREDFRVWSLPGGGIEPGETWEEAAVRETFEETGYRVSLDRLVGVYARPQLPGGGSITHVALASLRESGPDGPDGPDSFGWETVAVGWFPVDALPRSLNRFARLFIADALAGHPTPVNRTLTIPAFQAALVRLLFHLRDLRNRVLYRP